MCGPEPTIYKKGTFKMEYDWEYACPVCNGSGKEEKLSAGCTGQRMIRKCPTCNASGIVNKKFLDEYIFFECMKDFTKNKQDFLG